MRWTTSNWTRFGGAFGACVLMSAAALASEHGSKRVLFDFVSSEEQKSWRAVNDGVMGGRSKGAFDIEAQEATVRVIHREPPQGIRWPLVEPTSRPQAHCGSPIRAVRYLVPRPSYVA